MDELKDVDYVLAVRQPWAQLIADGLKTVEVRSKSTWIRSEYVGRIAIYASRTLKDELGFGLEPRPLPRGYILATAEIVDCRRYTSAEKFKEDDVKHMIPMTRINPDEFVGHYGWHLANVKKLEEPVEYKMPKGAVVWAKLHHEE